MKTLQKTLLLIVGLFVSINTFALGIEALAISPDGKTVVTSGQNYAIYVFDANNHSIKKRVRIDFGQGRANDLWFSKDGKSLWYVSDVKIAQFETSNWTQLKKISCSKAQISSDKTKILITESFDKKVHIIDASTGVIDKTFTHQGEERIEEIGFSVQTNQVLFLYASEDTDTEEEKQFSYSELEEMNIIERVHSKNKFDGEERKFIVINTTDGSVASKGSTWFSDNYNVDVVPGENGSFYLLSDEGVVTLDNSGKTTALNVDDDIDKAILSDDRKSIITIGHEFVSTYDVANKETKKLSYTKDYSESASCIIKVSNGYIVGMSNYELFFISDNGATKIVTVL